MVSCDWLLLLKHAVFKVHARGSLHQPQFIDLFFGSCFHFCGSSEGEHSCYEYGHLCMGLCMAICFLLFCLIPRVELLDDSVSSFEDYLPAFLSFFK